MSNQQGDSAALVLGLDLGPNSIGWALIGKADDQPRIIGAGVRVFEAGLDQLEMDGKGKSRNMHRREARGVRRRLERNSRRMLRVASALQRAGLLPPGPLECGSDRHAFFDKLDAKSTSPYQLRAQALEGELTPHELGRALYHLAQRRGFLSNRRSPLKKDEDKSKVYGSIGELDRQMKETGAPTLGALFAKADPRQKPIRGRYTARRMYLDEFEKIWEQQRRYRPAILTDAAKRAIHRAIFFQRPLQSQKSLIGHCELERERRRAPWALLIAQRFRLLQTLNNLQIEEDNDQGRELTDAERQTVLAALEGEGDRTFPQLRKLLGLPRTTKFNLERGGEKSIPGNRTAAKLADVFPPEVWRSFTDKDRDAVVEDVRSIVKDEALKKRGMKKRSDGGWGLDEEAAEKLSELELQGGYCSFSRQALEKLVPALERGVPLATAIKELYPDHAAGDNAPVDLLQPVAEAGLPTLRNPIVERALTEVRHLVNALVKRHGKPGLIRIELARELRQSSKQREDVWKRNRANQRDREEAAKKIAAEAGIENPRGSDILKALLYQECKGQCPYTGKSFKIADLFGGHPQFDIEHIIPFDRCLDDSYLNKTLCDVEENRRVKGNRTPYEAYHGTDRWDSIITRVRRFQGTASREKLRRFQLGTAEVAALIDNFTSRQLNDTRWTSKWAKRYLGLLYGGLDDDGIDSSGRRRVQATSGPVTAYLRNEWRLNSILGDGPGKSRDDHRHHAVDAIVTALADPATVKLLSEAAKRAAHYGRRLFEPVPPPWEGFHEQAHATIHGIVVSHRVSKRVRGALHNETFYGKPRKDEKGKEYVHMRVPLAQISAKDVENIVDPVVKARVRDRVRELGGDPKKAFKIDENHPWLEPPNGGRISIHHVRIKANLSTFSVGENERTRFVQSASNHHMEVVEVLDDEGRVTKWEGHVVSLYDAYQRLRRKQPVVAHSFGDGKRFVFSLANGEVIELDHGPDQRRLLVVRTIPQSTQIRFVPVDDARTLNDIGKIGLTAYPDGLRKLNCRKMLVTPLGEVRFAGD